MKTALLFCLTTVAMMAVAKTSTPSGWTDDYDAALKRAATERKLVLANFSGSDWCGWCEKLDKEVFDTEEFRKEATNAYVLLMVDSPSDRNLLSEAAKKRNPELVEKYKVLGFPALLVLDAQGEVVFRTGYEKGGPSRFLKLLEQGVREAPDVAKYIKPIEDVLCRYDEGMQKEEKAIKKRVESEFPAPRGELPSAREKRKRKMAERAGELFFGGVFAKFEPLYDKSLAEAKAMKVPPHMELKKMELVSRREQAFQAMKMARLRFEAMRNGDAEDEADEEDESTPNDGRWHGLEHVEAWAATVQTNAALPTAWKYFTGRFRPYVRRQLLPVKAKAFAKETAALVDGIARSLWAPYYSTPKPAFMRENLKTASELRDRGCSNLTVRALAAAEDYARDRNGRNAAGKAWRDVCDEMADELLARKASPLLRLLFAQATNSRRCGEPERDMLKALKSRPQDLRIVYNIIGTPTIAKEYDPWFGLMAEAESERQAAWKCRGGGYANSVKKEGWKGFYQHLGKATNLLEKAYALHPELPDTSYAMLSVVAPLASDEMHKWFDRVQALEVDHRRAWKTLVFHLLPRWYGSVEELRDLSAVLATITREDVPFLRYMSAHLLEVASKEATPEDRSAFFRDPELRARYLAGIRPIVDGDGADDALVAQARFDIVERFWDVGEYEAASREYQALVASAPMRFRHEGLDRSDYMSFVLPAFADAHGKVLMEVERGYRQKIANAKSAADKGKAEAEVKRLLKPLVQQRAKLTPAERRLVCERMLSLGMSDPVVTDHAWHVLPLEDGFPGWRLDPTARRVWKFQDGICRKGLDISVLEWASPLPADYELELDVTLNGLLQIHLDMRKMKKAGAEKVGVPTMTFKLDQKKIVADYTCMRRDWRMDSTKLQSEYVQFENARGRHRFTVMVRDGKATAFIDGIGLITESPLFKDCFETPRLDSIVGICGYDFDLHGVRYRRLNASPRPAKVKKGAKEKKNKKDKPNDGSVTNTPFAVGAPRSVNTGAMSIKMNGIKFSPLAR